MSSPAGAPVYNNQPLKENRGFNERTHGYCFAVAPTGVRKACECAWEDCYYTMSRIYQRVYHHIVKQILKSLLDSIFNIWRYQTLHIQHAEYTGLFYCKAAHSRHDVLPDVFRRDNNCELDTDWRTHNQFYTRKWGNEIHDGRITKRGTYSGFIQSRNRNMVLWYLLFKFLIKVFYTLSLSSLLSLAEWFKRNCGPWGVIRTNITIRNTRKVC